MAESGSGQEKTEEPTGKKLQDTRDQGQVPRSRELNTLLIMLVSGASFLILGNGMIERLMDISRRHFSVQREMLFRSDGLAQMFWDAVEAGLLAIAPLLLVLAVVAVVSPLSMGGWTFSAKALVPKLDKLDPVKGMGRVFSSKGLMELGKALIKFVLISTVGFFLMQQKLPLFMALDHMEFHQAVAIMTKELVWVFIILSASLLLITLVDVPFQLWDYRRQLKMTLQEIKDEHKESEGSPEVKGKVRQMQREIAQRRMMEAIPQADVVITNPSHYAVALKYDQLKMRAPIVVAIGVDLIALQIKRVAQAHEVPILEAPPLARALYHNSELGGEIPAGLYLAVAQVLAYIYQLKQYQKDGGIPPPPLNDIPIPDDLRRDE